MIYDFEIGNDSEIGNESVLVCRIYFFGKRRKRFTYVGNSNLLSQGKFVLHA
jgi:hypothetical protein